MPRPLYCPASVISQHASALDALLALKVPHAEAMNLLVASWRPAAVPAEADCRLIVAQVDGGREVAAVESVAERAWLACNLYRRFAAPSAAAALAALAGKVRRRRLIALPCFAAGAPDPGQGWHD